MTDMGCESNGTLKMIDIQDGVAWIAQNDDTSGAPHDIAGVTSVIFLADLFGKTPANIARRVVRYKNLNGL